MGLISIILVALIPIMPMALRGLPYTKNCCQFCTKGCSQQKKQEKKKANSKSKSKGSFPNEQWF
jgi:hypothetical protein